jgi:hypothetical protein
VSFAVMYFVEICNSSLCRGEVSKAPASLGTMSRFVKRAKSNSVTITARHPEIGADIPALYLFVC